MNAPVPTQNLPAERKPAYNEVAIESHGGGGMLRPSSLGEVVDLAQLMAKADVAVPKHLRGNVGACVSVAMQAFRWEMDPFAVANKSYSVNDRLAYEAQLCAAVVNMRAPIVGRPDYIFEGEGPSRTCKVVCVMRDGEVREYTSPRFDRITTKNSPLWKSDPDQQLAYFAIRSWARRHTPEVLLGVYTPDELRDESIRDVTPKPSGLRDRLTGPTTDEGFTSVNAPADPVDFAEQAEEIAEAEFEPAQADAPATAETPSSEPLEAVAAAPVSDFPGDRPSTARPAPTSSLSDRAAAYERRIGEASSVTKLRSYGAAAKQLLADLDAADPERKVELDQAYDARMFELEDAERAAADQ